MPKKFALYDVPGKGDKDRWWRKEWCIKGVYIGLAVVGFLALVALVWSIVLCVFWYSLRSKARQLHAARHTYVNAYVK